MLRFWNVNCVFWLFCCVLRLVVCSMICIRIVMIFICFIWLSSGVMMLFWSGIRILNIFCVLVVVMKFCCRMWRLINFIVLFEVCFLEFLWKLLVIINFCLLIILMFCLILNCLSLCWVCVICWWRFVLFWLIWWILRFVSVFSWKLVRLRCWVGMWWVWCVWLVVRLVCFVLVIGFGMLGILFVLVVIVSCIGLMSVLLGICWKVLILFRLWFCCWLLLLFGNCFLSVCRLLKVRLIRVRVCWWLVLLVGLVWFWFNWFGNWLVWMWLVLFCV